MQRSLRRATRIRNLFERALQLVQVTKVMDDSALLRGAVAASAI
jgi:hypothetical protein